MSEYNFPPKRSRAKKFFIGAGIIFILSVIGSVMNDDAKEAKTPSVPEKVASFTGTIVSWDAINPVSGRASFSITNSGEIAGVPKCKVKVQDDSGTYAGYDWPMIEQSLAPKETVKGNILLTVTKEGAAYITRGSVTCD